MPCASVKRYSPRPLKSATTPLNVELVGTIRSSRLSNWSLYGALDGAALRSCFVRCCLVNQPSKRFQMGNMSVFLLHRCLSESWPAALAPDTSDPDDPEGNR